jgi:hypothetical protein
MPAAKIKSFMVLIKRIRFITSDVNGLTKSRVLKSMLLKLFSLSIMKSQNKLECLSQTSLPSLDQYL